MDAPTENHAIKKFFEENDQSAINFVAKDLVERNDNLLQLVESLGGYLTNDDVETRKKAIIFMAEVLHRIPQKFVTGEQAEVLCTFFLSRLKDHHSVTPAILHGLNALSTFTNLPEGAAPQICQDIFREVETRSLQQGDRASLYKLISNFLGTRLNELKALGDNFVFGYIQVMDEEKDPRNLSLAFRIVPIIIGHFPIDNFAEDLFEITSCYFPIDFTPPPNDPYKITREELILGLRKCMTCTPLFAEFCYPILVEKMSSDIPSARLDSFLTLAEGAGVYGTKFLKEFSSSIAEFIKNEVFAASSESLEAAALSALTAMTKTLSGDSQTNVNADLNEFLEELFNEVKRHLNEPEHKLMFPSGTLLQAAASGSQLACAKVAEHVIPLLIEQFHKHVQGYTRTNILSVIIGFIKISNGFLPDGFVIMRPYRDELLTIFLTLLSDSNSRLRCLAVTGLMAFTASKHMLSETEMSGIVDQILQKCLIDDDAVVRRECITSLAVLGTDYPTLITDRVLPVLEKQLNAERNADGTVEDKSRLRQTLISISTHHTIIKLTVPILINSIKSLLEVGELNGIEEIAALLLPIVKESCSDPLNLEYFTDVTFKELLTMCFQSVIESHPITNSPNAIIFVGNIVQAIVEKSGAADCIVHDTLDVFINGHNSSLLNNNNKKLYPLELSASINETRLIVLLQAVLCASPKQALKLDFSNVMNKLTDLALQSPDETTRITASKCLAGVLNKLESNTSLDELINITEKRLSTLIYASGDDSQSKAVHLWSWVAKSLILKGHKKSSDFSKKILDLLSHPTLGLFAADAFFIILNEYDDVLCKNSNSNIRFMYKQRFFLETRPLLVEGFNSATGEEKTAYLTALSYLLRFIPKQVLLSELPPLLPLMIQSLQGSCADLHLSTMNVIYDLVLDAPEILSKQVDALIPQFIKLSSYKPSMKVRIAALQCLGAITTLPHPVLFPHQKQVLLDLGHRLDDKKRQVRTEAVKARGEWFLLGTSSK